VVGHDGSVITEFTNPPLTTVRQPGDRLALEVGRSVLSLVSGRDVLRTAATRWKGLWPGSSSS
ncbi:hypothetical protein ACWEPR_39700, partial [Streptomyces sp. NPDC004290]